MRGWFNKLRDQLWNKHDDLVLLNLFANRQRSPLPETPEQHRDTTERQKWKPRPAPELIEGRSCTACGGKLAVEILNYHYEHVTDTITPADKLEKCLSCGEFTVFVSRAPERLF